MRLVNNFTAEIVIPEKLKENFSMSVCQDGQHDPARVTGFAYNVIVTYFSVSLHMLGSYHWQVPVSVSSSVNPRETVASTLLDQTSCTVTVKGVKADQWIKVGD